MSLLSYLELCRLMPQGNGITSQVPGMQTAPGDTPGDTGGAAAGGWPRSAAVSGSSTVS